MSAEIINLRQARKQRARDRKDAEAAENRARHGRARPEREAEAKSRARAEQVLDGHFRLPLTTEPADAEDHGDGLPTEKRTKPPR